ncbi:type II toxin-antitoxin system RelE/ParE family toxin [Streptomyces sp. NBC_00878]|uniref:type II toxin-antitoxin system RelE family toxin n=1 Tax=Streptomyces sp. NBC_00878 TaxID=2975854 RepID=UPI002258D111|nr:type II toxin-antitoxin system RelE/ParE family toxin [Streptomyces sp. NBC_00878]MCX4906183.1 type II toxin-antitoxin system RelE/ParE family toxin [Streptomyces sp. NBC_00878]
MTCRIVWEPSATNAAVRSLKDAPNGLALVLDTIDKLADDPRPTGSIVYTSPSLRRLHVGDYRVLYVIDDSVIRILITHLGRTP